MHEDKNNKWRLTTNPFYILPLCCQETDKHESVVSVPTIPESTTGVTGGVQQVHLQSLPLGTSEVATGLSAAVRAVDTEPEAKRSAATVAISSTFFAPNCSVCTQKAMLMFSDLDKLLDDTSPEFMGFASVVAS